MKMLFEWDDAKSEKNRRERGFGFDFAALIFEGPVIEWCDVREVWGEPRIVAVGQVEGIILAVVYTDRGDTRRIISARRARKKEGKLWQSFANP
jgi:uncharacterized DUF497 family protein